MEPPKNFIKLLNYYGESMVNEEKLEMSVKHIFFIGNGKITTRKYRALLGNQERTAQQNLEDNNCIMTMLQY